MTGRDVVGVIGHEPKSFEAGALAALDYITDERQDLDSLCLRVAEKIGEDVSALPDWPRGPVDDLHVAAELLHQAVAAADDLGAKRAWALRAREITNRWGQS